MVSEMREEERWTFMRHSNSATPSARADAHTTQLLVAAHVDGLHGIDLVAIPEDDKAV